MGQWRERTQLQLSALIQFTASLGEIITALKPVSTVQRGSRTKAPILSFKYSPRVSGILWRGRGTLEVTTVNGEASTQHPSPGHMCPTHAFKEVSHGPAGKQCKTVTLWFSSSGRLGSGKLQSFLCQILLAY